MSIPRRRFLKSGILSALSAGVVLGSVRAGFSQKSKRGSISLDSQTRDLIPLEAQQDPVFMFSHATFDPYVGDIFQAPNALGQMVTLTLVKVDNYKPQRSTKLSTRPATVTNCFSLTFQASGTLPPFTSIHRISHPALGTFDLFLTPRQADGIMFYEAVINHF